MSLPDQRTVSFIQFEKLASDACVILEKNPLDDFFIQKKISGGTFGQVYKVVEKGTNLSFAAKIMKWQNNNEKSLIINEYSLTKLSQHFNIIEYYFFYEYNNEIWIIQELMDLSLTSILSRVIPLPENIIVYFGLL